MSCPGSVGYNGYLLIGSNTLPYLTGGLSSSKDIIDSEPLSVSSSAVYSSQYNYIAGRDLYKGNFSTEIYASGAYGIALKTLIAMAVRSNKCSTVGGAGGAGSFIFSPNGKQMQTITGKAAINTFSLRGNPGGNVQLSFGLVATSVSQTPSTEQATISFETVGNTDDGNPLPYYSSSFTTLGSSDDSLIATYLMDWNLNISYSVTPIYTFCPGVTTPYDLRLGIMQVTGDFCYYNPAGIYDSSLSTASIIIDLILGRFTLGNVKFIEDSVPSQGQNDVIFRHVKFRAFGTSNAPSITFA